VTGEDRAYTELLVGGVASRRSIISFTGKLPPPRPLPLETEAGGLPVPTFFVLLEPVHDPELRLVHRVVCTLVPSSHRPAYQWLAPVFGSTSAPAPAPISSPENRRGGFHVLPIALLEPLLQKCSSRPCSECAEAPRLSYLGAGSTNNRQTHMRASCRFSRSAEARGNRLSELARQSNAKRRAAGQQLGNTASLEQHGTRGHATMRGKADEFAQKVLPIIEKLQADHHAATGKRLTLAGIASALDDMGVQPARGGRWHAATIKRLLERAQAAKRVSGSNRRAKDNTAPQPPSVSPQTTSSEKDDPNWGTY
jgi:hypothetical protein